MGELYRKRKAIIDAEIVMRKENKKKKNRKKLITELIHTLAFVAGIFYVILQIYYGQ